MSDAPRFLGVDQVLAIHERVIEEHGGDPSIRDRGMLEAAVQLPRATFDGELLHASVPEMGAAYLFHLCMNHPFVDGNKRTALASAEVFLYANGFELRAGDEDVYELTMGVASSEASKAEVVAFFVEHARAS